MMVRVATHVMTHLTAHVTIYVVITFAHAPTRVSVHLVTHMFLHVYIHVVMHTVTWVGHWTSQVFLDWGSVVTRIWNGAEHLEVEWTAGPIPIDDKRGKELVVRYASNVSSGDTFYTDSNGREMLERRRDFRPTWLLNVTEPISGNFYPLTAAIYIQVRLF